MPIRNEAAHLAAAVGAVTAQDYPGRVRIFLGVGPSDDGTEQVATELVEHLAADGIELTVVDNPSGLTPAALNVAIRAGTRRSWCASTATANCPTATSGGP